MSSDRSVRYLVYAIGEIALVVIGILIALQVNNWNESKLQREREMNTLHEISAELAQNIEQLDRTGGGVLRERKRQESIRLLIAYFDRKGPYHDSLDQHFNMAMNLGGYIFRNSGYQSLLSTGLDQIADPELRSAISKLYSDNVTRLDRMFNETRDDFYNYMLDFLRKDFIYIKATDSARFFTRLKPRDYDNLMKNGEFIQSLKVYSFIHMSYLLRAQNVLSESKKVNEMIQKELAR